MKALHYNINNMVMLLPFLVLASAMVASASPFPNVDEYDTGETRVYSEVDSEDSVRECLASADTAVSITRRCLDLLSRIRPPLYEKAYERLPLAPGMWGRADRWVRHHSFVNSQLFLPQKVTAIPSPETPSLMFDNVEITVNEAATLDNWWEYIDQPDRSRTFPQRLIIGMSKKEESKGKPYDYFVMFLGGNAFNKLASEKYIMG
jgi:hypothetical protein